MVVFRLYIAEEERKKKKKKICKKEYPYSLSVDKILDFLGIPPLVKEKENKPKENGTKFCCRDAEMPHLVYNSAAEQCPSIVVAFLDTYVTTQFIEINFNELHYSANRIFYDVPKIYIK